MNRPLPAVAQGRKGRKDRFRSKTLLLMIFFAFLASLAVTKIFATN